MTTADEISKRIGDATIGIRSVNDTASDSQLRPAAGRAMRRQHQPLVQPERHQLGYRPPADQARGNPDACIRMWHLIFHKNMPVVAARLIKYYNAPEFRWGGSGKQRRLGLAACVMAVFTLAASVLFADFAASLPEPSRYAGRAAVGWRSPIGTVPQVRRLPVGRHRAGGSGYLVEIK